LPWKWTRTTDFILNGILPKFYEFTSCQNLGPSQRGQRWPLHSILYCYTSASVRSASWCQYCNINQTAGVMTSRFLLLSTTRLCSKPCPLPAHVQGWAGHLPQDVKSKAKPKQ
jgi:hypothetical protein